MILIDTSVWIDHLRRGDSALVELLSEQRVFTHPFIIGELALGFLQERAVILGALQNLPHVTAATDDEVLRFIDSRSLAAQGIGYIDVHLLAAAALTPGTLLWTRDKQLRAAAERLGFHAGLS